MYGNQRKDAKAQRREGEGKHAFASLGPASASEKLKSLLTK
jgi:hypothetical protein